MIACSKYEGCGNDFIIVKAVDCGKHTYDDLAKRLCDRHMGIGADGLIIVADEPLTMHFYNCDGTEAMCGNGLRCFARYVYEEGICNKRSYLVRTKSGDMQVHVDATTPFLVSITSPKPSMDAQIYPDLPAVALWDYPLEIAGTKLSLDACFVISVHAIVYGIKKSRKDLVTLGEALCEHSLFPNGTNVNFVEVLDRTHLRVTTYERGVGMSNACGSGCCAAVWDAFVRGYVERVTEVLLPYGTITITVHEDERITMQGSARCIMKGIAECI